MNADLTAILALLIPVVTEVGVQWKKFPLSRKNAPIAVVVLSFLLSIGYVWSLGTLELNVATVGVVFGYTAVTTALAAFLYEYVWKLVLVRGFSYVKNLIK